MLADCAVGDSQALEQWQRLRVVPGGHLRLVPRLPQSVEDGPEDDRMGGGGHVDPDPHLGPGTLADLTDGAGGTVGSVLDRALRAAIRE